MCVDLRCVQWMYFGKSSLKGDAVEEAGDSDEDALNRTGLVSGGAGDFFVMLTSNIVLYKYHISQSGRLTQVGKMVCSCFGLL